jgi:predicted DNA-binding transcriptional regulator YafY
MPINKQQLRRMIRFVAQMKENRYPNCARFIREMRDNDDIENENLVCTTRTILRDIQALKSDFNAPIRYDAGRRGYYLTNPGWQFPCPDFDEDVTLAFILGARVAEDIFPEPLRSRIRTAAQFHLANADPAALEAANPRLLTLSTRLKTPLDPEVFKAVFDGWRTAHAVILTYRDARNRESKRLVEPHILSFHGSSWYLKGYCLERRDIRVFALRRIIRAELTDKTFTPDPKLAEDVYRGQLFDYQPLRNVVLLCAEQLRDFVETDPFHPGQILEPDKPGYFHLRIPAVAEHEIRQWVLYQAGLVQVCAPASLARSVLAAARKIENIHASCTAVT